MEEAESVLAAFTEAGGLEQPEGEALVVGDIWCVIASEWMESLETWIDPDTGPTPPPGPIDNSRLLVPPPPGSQTESHDLYPTLKPKEDYLLVRDSAYDFLHATYGGGPKIPRAVVAMGASRRPQVELFPLSIIVVAPRESLDLIGYAPDHPAWRDSPFVAPSGTPLLSHRITISASASVYDLQKAALGPDMAASSSLLRPTLLQLLVLDSETFELSAQLSRVESSLNAAGLLTDSFVYLDVRPKVTEKWHHAHVLLEKAVANLVPVTVVVKPKPKKGRGFGVTRRKNPGTASSPLSTSPSPPPSTSLANRRQRSPLSISSPEVIEVLDVDSPRLFREAAEKAVLSHERRSMYSRSSTSSSSSSSGGPRPRLASASVVRTGGNAGPGLMGLANLGNTCFMNSALQVLLHVDALRTTVMADSWESRIVENNPLGTGGDLARSFADLVRTMWAGSGSAVRPLGFKWVISRYAPQFQGYSQHDAAELLTFVLDGLHEDVNQAARAGPSSSRSLPTQNPVGGGEDGGDDTLASTLAWSNHVARNDSVVVDLFHGLLKSSLACATPTCSHVSSTFDPYMYLQLPLTSSSSMVSASSSFASSSSSSSSSFPEQHTWVIQNRGGPFALEAAEGFEIEVVVKNEKERDRVGHAMTEKLAGVLGIDPDEVYLLPAHGSKSGMGLVGDVSALRVTAYAFRVPPAKVRHANNTVVVPVVHRVAGDKGDLVSFKVVGAPFVVVLPRDGRYDELQSALRVAAPPDVVLCFEQLDAGEVARVDPGVSSGAMEGVRDPSPDDFGVAFVVKFVACTGRTLKACVDETYSAGSGSPMLAIEWSSLVREQLEMVTMMTSPPSPSVVVDMETDDGNGPVLSVDRAVKRGATPLEAYLGAFVAEEALAASEAWECPACGETSQAVKRIELFRFPQILVVQLKRFQTRASRLGLVHTSKIETLVDFPLTGLDVGRVVSGEGGGAVYDLVGVINHFGVASGGHYTAYAQTRGEWYEFNDSRVSRVSSPSCIVTKAAYVLVYVRRPGR